MMDWISIDDELPRISYLESDNADDPYESYPVLVYSPEPPGNCCVAYLVKNQEADEWNFEEPSWEIYIPANGGSIINASLETFTHWMPLPKFPKE